MKKKPTIRDMELLLERHWHEKELREKLSTVKLCVIPSTQGKLPKAAETDRREVSEQERKQALFTQLQSRVEELEAERGQAYGIEFVVVKTGWTQADYADHLRRLEQNRTCAQ
jgi:hypothetical protein